MKTICVDSWAMNASFANKIKNKEFILLQSVMNFATIIIVIVALQFFRKSQREMNVLCDEENITAGDFSAVVKFIPNCHKDVDYHELIKSAFDSEKHHLSEVSLCFDLTEYQNAK